MRKYLLHSGWLTHRKVAIKTLSRVHGIGADRLIRQVVRANSLFCFLHRTTRIDKRAFVAAMITKLARFILKCAKTYFY